MGPSSHMVECQHLTLPGSIPTLLAHTFKKPNTLISLGFVNIHGTLHKLLTLLVLILFVPQWQQCSKGQRCLSQRGHSPWNVLWHARGPHEFCESMTGTSWCLTACGVNQSELHKAPKMELTAQVITLHHQTRNNLPRLIPSPGNYHSLEDIQS